MDLTKLDLTRLYKPLRLPVRLIPDAVHTEMLVRICNHMLRGQSIASRLQDLNGKIISIHITDADTELLFIFKDGRLHRASKSHWDTRISGTLADFYLLATRAEDPDTLFFNRRLCLEGDTETSLYIKNVLDALEYDWEAHFNAVFGRQPPASLSRVLTGISSRLGFRAGH